MEQNNLEQELLTNLSAGNETISESVMIVVFQADYEKYIYI